MLSYNLSRTINVEYNQLDPCLRATEEFKDGDVNDKSGYSPFPGNINQLLFKLDAHNKILERTQNRIRGGLSQAAPAGCSDGFAEFAQIVEIFRFALALYDLVQALLQKDISHPAGCAVAATLFDKELHETLSHPKDIPVGSEDHD